MRKIFKLILKIIVGFILFLALYFIAAFGLSYLSSNSDFKQCETEAVEVYILTNGVHTDIVCPVKNEYKDWSDFVKPADTKAGDTLVKTVAFGWGDKGFYLDTKTWADLKFKTAFNALFYLSSSAMHVTFYKSLQESESCKKICINKVSYMKLVNYIESSFVIDSLGNPIQIKGASYYNNDSFYEVKGTYNLFFTCNTWANRGLKTAGMKASVWPPFHKGIFNKYSDV